MTKQHGESEYVAFAEEPEETTKTSLAKKALATVGLVAVAACVYVSATTSSNTTAVVAVAHDQAPVTATSLIGAATAPNALGQCTTGVVTLQSDIGTFLGRCANCYPNAAKPYGPDTVSPWVSDPTSSMAKWHVVRIDDKRVALRSDQGKYLARCNKCISDGAYPGTAIAHVADWRSTPRAVWTVETLPNGNVALKADSGRYLARCNSCAWSPTTSELATVHVTKPMDEPWGQWAVGCVAPSTLPRPTIEGQAVKCEGGANPLTVYRFLDGRLRAYPSEGVATYWDPEWTQWTTVDCSGIPRGPAFDVDPYEDTPARPIMQCGSGVIALQADINTFLARCENCFPDATGAYGPDAVSPYIEDPKTNTNAVWHVVRIDEHRIALRSDQGKYLARCTDCISNAAYPVTAFAYVSDWRASAEAIWTIESLVNGKIALKADTGRYLARCNGCAWSPETSELATIHVTKPATETWGQWCVQCVSGLPRPTTEGQPVKCEGDTDARRVYRFTKGKVRWYPNPQIAWSWDADWHETWTTVDCSGIVRGQPMPLKPACPSGQLTVSEHDGVLEEGKTETIRFSLPTEFVSKGVPSIIRLAPETGIHLSRTTLSFGGNAVRTTASVFATLDPRVPDGTHLSVQVEWTAPHCEAQSSTITFTVSRKH